MTFCNPYLMKQPGEECEYVSETGMEIQEHVKDKPDKNKDNPETAKDQNVTIPDRNSRDF